MKEEFDAFFEELPQDDAPPSEREEFLLKFKKKNRPADRLGRLAHDGRQLAAEIVKAVSEEGLEKAKELLGKIEADPSRGYAYLYACQLALPKVPSDPAKYLDFAKAIAEATRSLPYLKDKGPAQPVCREQVLGEAALLESSALNFLGRAAPRLARSAQRARINFVAAGEDSFALALADYFEGSAATFAGDFARRLEAPSKRARRNSSSTARRTGRVGPKRRSECLLLGSRKAQRPPFIFFDGALRILHPELDGAAYAIDPRKPGLFRSSGLAASTRPRPLTLEGSLLRPPARTERSCCLNSVWACNDRASEGKLVLGALSAFERISEDARASGLEALVLGADLRVAECLAGWARAIATRCSERVEPSVAVRDTASLSNRSRTPRALRERAKTAPSRRADRACRRLSSRASDRGVRCRVQTVPTGGERKLIVL